MATRKSGDVKLQLSVETLGGDEIKKLGDELQSLANQGGDAAPRLQELADQVARIGQQSQAVKLFQDLATESDQLAAKQTEAAAAVEKMAVELQAAQKAANEASQAQREANRALVDAQRAYAATGTEIKLLNQQYKGAQRDTEAYRSAMALLLATQGQQNAAIIEQREARRQANTLAKEAAAAESKLEATYVRSLSAQKALDSSVRQSNEARDAAKASAEKLGVALTSVATAEAELLQTLKAAASEGRATSDAMNTQAAAAERLAQAEREAVVERGKAIQSIHEEVQATLELGRSFDAMGAALQQHIADQERAAQAEHERAAAAADMAENNRLWAIQQQAANELARRGADALEAEKVALREAAQAANLYEAAKKQQAASERQAAEEAEKAAARIDNAFKTVGVRSVEDLQREINDVRAAMQLLGSTAGVSGQQIAGAFAAGNARIKSLERDIREVTGTLTTADKAARLFSNSMGQITAGNLIADGIGYLVEKVKDMGRAFIESIVGIDQMRRGLNAIYKDSSVTAQQIDFLRKAAGEAGIAAGSLSEEFVKFSAAMTSAGVPLQQSNALFKELVSASAALGLGAEETAGSLNALGQMASKGVVSMEELRQQLGDRLPGAFGLVAQGLGITQAELVKLVESGGLAARDLFPALTKALATMRGETDGLVPTWERLKGSLQETAQAAGDAGWTEILTAGLKALGVAAATILVPLQGFFEVMGGLARSAGVLAGALATLTNPMEALRDIWSQSGDRLGKLQETFKRVIVTQDQATDAANRQVAANTSLNTSTADVLRNATNLDRAQQLAAVATALAGNAALDASAKYVQYNLAATNLLKAQQAVTQAANDSAKAAKIEGESLVQIARIRGEQQGVLEASAQAAEKERVALEALAKSRQIELDILTQQRAAIETNRVARNLSTEDVKIEVTEIEKKILAAKGEVEQSKQTAEAMRVEQEQRKLAVQTYADNSKRVDEYRASLAAAVTALQATQQAQRNNLATEDEVRLSKERLAQAQALFNDSLRDSVTALQLEASAKSANLQLESANFSARAQSATIMANQAKLLGDSAQAYYYELEAKRANIEITRINYEIKKLEAQAEIAALEIAKASIPVNDALREQKIKEIEIRLQLQRVKLAEANAGDEVVRALERELQAMRNNQNQRASGITTINSDSSARDRNTQSINAQTAALEKQKLTSDGLRANADGSAAGTFGNTLPVDQAFAIAERARRGQLTSADLGAAQTAFRQANNAREWLQAQNPGVVSTTAAQSADALYNATKLALEKVEEIVRLEKGQQKSPSGTSTSTTKTVQINIGGRATPVNVASDADSNALVGVLRQLETAAGASY